MLTISVTGTPFTINAGAGDTFTASLLEALKTRYVASVQDVLGRHDIYLLKPEYAKRKPFLKRYRHIAGKPSEQPLILSGDMYDAVEGNVLGSQLVVKVADSAGRSKSGFDYAGYWDAGEGGAQYMEKGAAEITQSELESLVDSTLLKALGW